MGAFYTAMTVVTGMGDMRNAYKMLFGKPEGKIPLGIPRHRWGK
jgi:hypothetical protein